ncbi:hypothetical protein KAR10_02095 [bacterium]|nr:hypothetical protein [bacterium]
MKKENLKRRKMPLGAFNKALEKVAKAPRQELSDKILSKKKKVLREGNG